MRRLPAATVRLAEHMPSKRACVVTCVALLITACSLFHVSQAPPLLAVQTPTASPSFIAPLRVAPSPAGRGLRPRGAAPAARREQLDTGTA